VYAFIAPLARAGAAASERATFAKNAKNFLTSGRGRCDL
jgi:hypothetical protein